MNFPTAKQRRMKKRAAQRIRRREKAQRINEHILAHGEKPKPKPMTVLYGNPTGRITGQEVKFVSFDESATFTRDQWAEPRKPEFLSRMKQRTIERNERILKGHS